MTYDAIVVGGSYAGLSAALQLARARRRVLVVDAGVRRNRFASATHGFLTQDGSDPGAVTAEGRAQLMEYDTVDWLSGTAESAAKAGGGFVVSVQGREPLLGRCLVLATGVRDQLPDVPGLAERWGRRVFHCPYCHGYELQQGRIGVLATSPMSVHQALMLPDWGPTTFLLNGVLEPDREQAEALKARGVTIEPGRIDRLEGEGLDVVMHDGRILPFQGLFVAARSVLASPLSGQLGCAVEEGPLGTCIKTDPIKATTVAGVFACGDAARMAGNVALAVGDGAIAGAAAHRFLMGMAF
ncbi:NAD(P)/FAD-dependent oxidoreductase [Schlegelella sp. S2-27]|uniref:NAD(P)/FAD-dependent oxidoreductase n=1 Tax=Caldimonas mangrovi TaxID=2944811 RepID=A0ABT0YUS6_9BURK|nr:NAD(P)/FAD-dependent oxidoreductase [Caldimonas mangrovi]MCM5682363.1 NAD(P)/FAD-dependent oxidoreductase [Caldimonas mangrovi]